MKLENFNKSKNIVEKIEINEKIKMLLSKCETKLVITNFENEYEITKGTSSLKMAIIDFLDEETGELRAELEKL